MQKLYESFKINQYPDRATKESLAAELGITAMQVTAARIATAAAYHYFVSTYFSLFKMPVNIFQVFVSQDFFLAAG